MKLTQDSEGGVWQFIQGESVIPLDGERTFSAREQAVAAARKVGLAIDKNGNVVIAGRGTVEKRNKDKTRSEDDNGNMPETQQRRRITLWLDPDCITRLDQLARSHGSRGEAVRWLLTDKQSG